MSDVARQFTQSNQDWLVVFAGDSCKENEERMDTEPNWEDEDYIVSNLTALGVVGIEDPVRPEVIHLLQITTNQNISVI